LATSASDDRERVREATDIVRLVGDYVALRPRGREYVGLCPFHDDHNPSMTVVPSKQIFKCFVCNAAGDVFSFVQLFHKMTFPEAMAFLAERAGITLSARRGDNAAEESGVSRTGLLEANARAGEFFRAVLRHDEHGERARQLIERRGISPEMTDAFALGAAPDRWDGLAVTARTKGLELQAFEEAGLIKARERSGGHFDLLRNRLVFPIHDQGGRVIAFGGRCIDDEDEPKYLNSPETRVFAKSATLYGLYQASSAIRSEGEAIITEGYTDVIACHQAGVANVVATLGTALTPGHARVLRRLCERVVLLFDGDEAGQRAADRAAEVFFAEPLDVRIAVLSSVTDAKDPDELLRRPGGADLFRQAIGSSRELLSFRFERLRARLAGAGVTALAEAVQGELARLADLGLSTLPPLRRRMVIQQLARLAGVPETEIIASLPGGRRRSARPESTDPGPGVGSTAHEHLVGCILCDPTLWRSLETDDRALLMSRARAGVKEVCEAVARIADAGREPTLTRVLDELEDLAARRACTLLAEQIAGATEEDPERLQRYWTQCVLSLRDGAEREHRTGLDAIERIRSRKGDGFDGRRLPRPVVRAEIRENQGSGAGEG
jgi:DNA primase